ncbi:CPBP family intramembrane glutamic endopeptidase [Bacillus cereus]|uniref:CPBP family intramembrane glutamic endopeptidase n=1 Tax=Bacillus cereus TaxID=1396 RepID=UPI001D0CE8C5|nr:CPBP family intramembrane glutamic endopeptidase [Bacillus cereus]
MNKVLRGSTLIIAWVFMLAFLIYSDKFLGFGLSRLSAGAESLFLLTLLLALLTTIPKLRRNFTGYLLLSDKINLIIGLPILLAIGMQVAFNFARFIPTWMGGEMIGVGSGQFTTSEVLSEMGERILVSIIIPFNEEFLFRYVPYAAILWGANIAKEHSNIFKKLYFNLFVEKNTKYVWVWILSTSFVFAMIHEPSVLNFSFYFIPGIVYAFLFLRYGLFSAILAHSSYNLFSGIIFEMVKRIL